MDDQAVEQRLTRIAGSIGVILKLLRELGSDVGMLVADLREEGRGDDLQVVEESLLELDALLTRALEFFEPVGD